MLYCRESQALVIDPEIVPQNYFAPLDLKAIYGRSVPIEVDLGCGDGSFLVAAAAANRARDFLGVDRRVHRVCKARGQIMERRLTNARVLWIETAYAVEQFFPAQSVDVFHLLFPDPWPKRRHSSRRIVTKEFLQSIHGALAPEGRLRIVTDAVDYFRDIEQIVGQSMEFIRDLDPEPAYPPSTFEERFSGLEIYRLTLRKCSLLR